MSLPTIRHRLALFDAYPQLETQLAYLPLAQLPTPIQDAADCAESMHVLSLHIKRDDATGAAYGGNKVRKLGFLLAQAKNVGAREVITFGGAGSNHALATALYARAIGMAATLILGPQYNSRAVRANLLAGLASGATLRGCAWSETPRETAAAFHAAWQRDGMPPSVIPPGGSSPFGALGYVNAAFELKQQIDAKMLPEPDLIYVASGTMGTCVGLAVGLRALRMKTQIMAVRVTTAPYTSMEHGQALFTATVALCRQHAPDFPALSWEDAGLHIEDNYFGEAYALFTTESVAAVKTARLSLNLALEGTYTGKTFAALLGHAAEGRLCDKRILFWNTYAGMPSAPAAPTSYQLPASLQTYFETPVQPLDL